MVGLLSLESCCGKPKMRNSVLKGLRDRKLDWFTAHIYQREESKGSEEEDVKENR